MLYAVMLCMVLLYLCPFFFPFHLTFFYSGAFSKETISLQLGREFQCSFMSTSLSAVYDNTSDVTMAFPVVSFSTFV